MDRYKCHFGFVEHFWFQKFMKRGNQSQFEDFGMYTYMYMYNVYVHNLCKYINYNICVGMGQYICIFFHSQSAALAALQEASESYLVGVLEDANLAARHAKETWSNNLIQGVFIKMYPSVIYLLYIPPGVPTND